MPSPIELNNPSTYGMTTSEDLIKRSIAILTETSVQKIIINKKTKQLRLDLEVG
jgi:hypothetical protein